MPGKGPLIDQPQRVGEELNCLAKDCAYFAQFIGVDPAQPCLDCLERLSVFESQLTACLRLCKAGEFTGVLNTFSNKSSVHFCYFLCVFIMIVADSIFLHML